MATSLPAADMKTNKRKSTQKLTVASLCAALGVVLLLIGSVVDVLDITMAALASLTVVFAVIELRGNYPWMIFAVTALLSLLLLPNKTPALLYAAIAGYYPIVKWQFEKRFSRSVAMLFKGIVFLGAAALFVYISLKFFVVAELVMQPWYWIFIPLVVVFFLLYDIAMTRLITFYLVRWRRHFRFLEKN